MCPAHSIQLSTNYVANYVSLSSNFLFILLLSPLFTPAILLNANLITRYLYHYVSALLQMYILMYFHGWVGLACHLMCHVISDHLF